ncbi:MAG: hypothetical protein EBQ99_01270 [Planctomycetes bacterium]|nr:hypothetical protein [Planctomycetota bacterium]
MMLPLLLIAASLNMSAPQAATGEDPQTRIRALEEENRRLREETEALQRRLRQLEGSSAPATPAARTTGSRDPGPEPWGNPNAAMRSLASRVREDLKERGIAIPTPDADARAWHAYRQRLTKWIENMGKFRQPVEWTIAVSEAVQVSSQPREFEIHAHVLRADGSRVEPIFTFRCPATAVPNLVPAKAPGVWQLKAELVPQLQLQPETASRERANPFGDTPTISPQLECTLRYVVQSMTPAPQPPVTPAK